jgi:flavin reductase (DIM6/NTAB) family NADH-FMN oxidoreductase RutF
LSAHDAREAPVQSARVPRLQIQRGIPPGAGPVRHRRGRRDDADGNAAGITVNSFCSLSIEPPLILWSLATGANSARAFRDCERFRVQVLNAGQLDVARQCATRGADKFAHGEWHDGRHGLPSLDGCVAWFECENHRQYDEGDHVIIVGRVTAFGGAGGTPLIFHAGRYVTDLAESPLPRELRAGPR